MARLVKRITKDGTHRFDVRAQIGPRNVTRTFIRRQDAEAFLREAERLERRAAVPVEAEHGEQTVKSRGRRLPTAARAQWPVPIVDDLKSPQHEVPAARRPTGGPGRSRSAVR